MFADAACMQNMRQRTQKIKDCSVKMREFTDCIFVGIGGFAGSIARFLVGRAEAAWFATSFPMSTFIVNIVGCFLVGVISPLAAAKLLAHSETPRLMLIVGFAGAFTTFSTFAFDTNELLEEGSWKFASLNIIATLTVGFIALRIGLFLARKYIIC